MYGNQKLYIDTFIAIMLIIFEELKSKLNQNHNKEKTIECITKKHLIALGILFSKSNVVGKIKLIFDLFKNEDDTFSKSEDFDEFLLTSFLICSYCMVSARRDVININNSIEELSREQLIKCLEVCELKDCLNLVKVFNDTFFEEDSLSWIDFKEKFENKGKGFQWILSPRGIRKKLEENNV